MCKCKFKHVPKRLHLDDKDIISSFEVGEQIYRRCKPEQIENPFNSISIADVSTNRQGFQENIISVPEDVLINTTSNSPEILDEQVVCVLEITDLLKSGIYFKEFSQTKGDAIHVAALELVHDPTICMFPHCEFRVHLNGQQVGINEYGIVIRKKLREIHTSLKQALASMIIKNQISQKYT